jgi:hypothetical protein
VERLHSKIVTFAFERLPQFISLFEASHKGTDLYENTWNLAEFVIRHPR